MTVLQDVWGSGGERGMQLRLSPAGATADTKPILPLARGNVFQFNALPSSRERLINSATQDIKNVTPMTGRVTPPCRSSAQQLAGLGGCSSKPPSTSAGHGCRGEGEHPFPSSSLPAPLLRSALPESCELQQLLLRKAGPANPAAVGGSSWVAKKQRNAHAKRGAMLIRNKSSNAVYRCVVICTAAQSQEECLSPEGRVLT